MEEKLIDYIKKEREKGFSDEAIKEALKNVGYTADRVNYAFQEIAKQPISNNMNNIDTEPNQTNTQNVIVSFYEKEKRMINIIFMILAVIVIVICFILLLNMIWSGDDSNLIIPPNPNQSVNKSVAVNKSTFKGYFYNDSNFNNVPLKGAGCGYENIRISKMCRAVFKSDESICDPIEDNYDKTVCIYYVKVTKAIITNDKKICAGLSSEPLRVLCGAAIDKNNGICNLATNSSQKEECVNVLALFNAIRTKDESKCNVSIVEDRDKSFCKTMISSSDQIRKSIEPCRKYYDIGCP